jgi:DNA-binding GntR family transcriptional regulator
MGNHAAAEARHATLAAAILRLARMQGWSRGQRMTELDLAASLGVSRTPVRAALRRLAQEGYVTPHADRGFVLAAAGRHLAEARLAAPDTAEATLHAALVQDRIAGRLPPIVAQATLARRYGAGRPLLARVLTRMQHEGLIAPAHGQGWAFAPTLESEASRRAAFELRLALEPAALLLPGFRPDAAMIARLREEHTAAARWIGQPRPDAIAIFTVDMNFHEALAEMAGNPFILAAIRQQNVLRRLLELASYRNAARVRAWIGEHLAILDHVAADDMAAAAKAMRLHLGAAAAQPIAAGGPARPRRATGE